ncbi:hypothetical protein J6590_003988 [Homalodisca vitripennis]|nr:hypothetical protein J6590_003988 [Homalodisca vitripennis]
MMITSQIVELLRRQITFNNLGRDLRSGKYRSEMHLTISEGFSDVRRHLALLGKKEKHPSR